MAVTVQPRRIGALEEFPRITSLDDPRLGLAHEALIERLDGVPEELSPEMSRRLAELVHAVVSGLVGELSTHRGSLDPMLDVLAGACAAERFDEEEGELDAPFDEVRANMAALRTDATFGWGSGSAGLRRLSRLGPIAADRGGEIAFDGPGDHRTLDGLWYQARRRMGRRAALPLEVCSAFVPAERELVVDQIGPFTAPSAWQMVAQWIVWGPVEVRLRVLEYLADEASRELAPRANRSEGGRLSGESLLNKAAAARQLCDRIHDRSDLFGSWDAWRARMEPIALTDIDAEVDGWRADRRAVPLVLYRRRRADLIARIESRRRRDGTFRDGAFYALRDLLLLSLAGETGARSQSIAALVPGDIDFGHVWEDSPYVGPAVRIRPMKRGRRTRNVSAPVRWKAISVNTARYLADWLNLIRAAERPEQTIWMSHWVYPPGAARIEANRMAGGSLGRASLSARLSGCKAARSVPILPRPGGGGYSIHCLRHAAAQHAHGVGVELIRMNDRHAQRVSAQVLPDALLDHTPRSDLLGYQDLVRNRDLWALRAAVGSRADGRGDEVPGVLDILDGPAGARRGFDIAAIALAERAVVRARDELDAAAGLLAERKLERQAAERRPLPALPDGDMCLEKAIALMLQRDVAREERERRVSALSEEVEELHDRVAGRRKPLDAALARRQALLAERTFAVPDSEPTTGELRQQAIERWRAAGNDGLPPGLGEVAGLERESPEQAVARAGLVLLDADEDEAEVTPARVRHHLNMPEMAALLGLSDGGLRKLVNGGTKRAPFPVEGPDSVVEVAGPKLRFFDADRLPAAFVARLLPEQRETLEQMLAVPMGSTPWGGRSRRGTA